MFLSRGDGYVRDLLELPQGCPGHFRSSRGKMGFLSRLHSEKGPHLTLRGESPDFSRVAAANLGPSRVKTRTSGTRSWGPQECPVSMRAPRGLLVFFCSRCQGRGPLLVLRQEPQISSPLPVCILGLLWSFHRVFRTRLVWAYERPLSSRAGKAVSGFLSC